MHGRCSNAESSSTILARRIRSHSFFGLEKIPKSAESQPAVSADIGSVTAPRLAIAHDYLTQRGGAERVVLALHRAFPEAPIYTTLYNPEGTFPEFEDATIITSPLNRVGLLRRYHRLALPLLPLTASCLKVPAHVAVVSTTGWAHGFKFTGEKLVYCHSPARWLYLRDQYLGDEKKNSVIGVGLRVIDPLLRFWDQRAAARSEHYVANSTAIQERISRVYGKDVPIIFPPYSGAQPAWKNRSRVCRNSRLRETTFCWCRA